MLPTVRKQLIAMGGYLAIAIAISLWVMGSPNPISVYSGDSLVAKIFVSVLLAFVVVAAVGVVQIQMLRWFIQATTGQPAEDVRCAGEEGHPLWAYMALHGPATRCRQCGRWWHRNCFLRNNPFGPSMQALMRPCTICQRESEQVNMADFGDV